jgi:hypothetical protein
MGAATLPVLNGTTSSTQVAVWLDEAFRQMNPPLSRGELAGLESLLKVEGCRDALIVWQETGLLLDGYNRHAICQRWGIAFKVSLLSLPDREAAQDWILSHQGGRRNLTPKGWSYLRGQRYALEKGRPGGTGANQYQRAQRGENEYAACQRTAERLAREYKVCASTIQRDELFMRAVDLITEKRTEIKRLILSRDARLRHDDVLQLKNMAREEREKILAHLVATGQVQRPWVKPRTKMLFALEPKRMVPQIMKRLGQEGVEEVIRLLIQKLEKSKTGKDQGASDQAEERS